MSSNKIYFVGFSKNCFKNLKKNSEFLIGYLEHTKKKCNFIIIDSDSSDGSKEYCAKLVENQALINFFEIDGLENNFNSRIERLAFCRNFALDILKDDLTKKIIFIPMDMDLELFNFVNYKELDVLIDIFINSNFDGLFPFSLPFYYDIFALRSKGWVSKNNLLIANNLKQKYKLGSFFYNYFYIFKHQINLNKINTQYIKVSSAFGGMGMYKMDKNNLQKALYKVDKEDTDFVSEHISFNKNFKNLAINIGWNIKAPDGYIFFNTYSYKDRLLYFFKSTKYDFKRLLGKMN